MTLDNSAGSSSTSGTKHRFWTKEKQEEFQRWREKKHGKQPILGGAPVAPNAESSKPAAVAVPQRQPSIKGEGSSTKSNRRNRRGKSKDKPKTEDNEKAEPMKQRSRRNRNNKQNQGKVGGGRRFNGSLTKDGDDAVEFQNKPSVQTTADGSSCLSSALSKRLANSSYECMICCDKVRVRHAIWNCDRCWAVFHVGCIKKWAKSSTTAGSDTSATTIRWRCPGCQYERAALPTHYVCFCGAIQDPEHARGQTPHSCGQVCGRNRGPNCPHTCPSLCHPGPCPPCTSVAPEQSCFCGRLTYQPRCGAQFDPVSGTKSCGAVCGEMLGCGQHTCQEECHGGLCPPCPHKEEQMCYCGKHTRMAKCGEGRKMTTLVRKDGAQESTVGCYSCNEPCTELLDCGMHRCERPCHVRSDPNGSHGHCSLDPAIANTCHCGKHKASDLGQPRNKCTDPVPACGEPCQLQLSACIHKCEEPCHSGPCPPCQVLVDAKCRCGTTTVRMECHKASTNQPQCDRVCTRRRSCKRHQCCKRCCPSDHVDVGGIVVPSEDILPGETDPHQCTQICGRMLKCRRHQCQELCHRGACPPCLEAGFEEISCPCGRTRLYPPVSCGTELPTCHHPCQNVRPCGHVTPTSHECHQGPCPPCAVLVPAQCMCGNKELRNVPCHRSHAASCGVICGRQLPCGGHRCQRSCHRPDEPCLPEGKTCRQACGKPRRSCGHPCKEPCHSPSMCPEVEPCQAAVPMSCPCGRLSRRRTCGSTASNPREAADNKLECDEVCKIAERNRQLALALNLNDKAEVPLAGMVKVMYSEDLLQYARANGSWVRDIEDRVAMFIGDSGRITLRFEPMKRPQRTILHALSAFYGCSSISMDREPLRSVWWNKSTQSTIPSIVLSCAIKYTNPPSTICSNRIMQQKQQQQDDGEFDDTASHHLEGTVATSTPFAGGYNPAAERLRRKIDYISVRDLRHGLTEDELSKEIRKLFPSAPFRLEWRGEDLVEMFCTDIGTKYENLCKWESMLKSKLPHLGVAGLVVGRKFETVSKPLLSSSSSSSSSKSDRNVPEDWESLN